MEFVCAIETKNCVKVPRRPASGAQHYQDHQHLQVVLNIIIISMPWIVLQVVLNIIIIVMDSIYGRDQELRQSFAEI